MSSTVLLSAIQKSLSLGIGFLDIESLSSNYFCLDIKLLEATAPRPRQLRTNNTIHIDVD